jgi:hypothetical protein
MLLASLVLTVATSPAAAGQVREPPPRRPVDHYVSLLTDPPLVGTELSLAPLTVQSGQVFDVTGAFPTQYQPNEFERYLLLGTIPPESFVVTEDVEVVGHYRAEGRAIAWLVVDGKVVEEQLTGWQLPAGITLRIPADLSSPSPEESDSGWTGSS